MNVNCPKCGKQLKLSDKFKESLRQLKPEQKARVKCIQCEEPFQIDGAMLNGKPVPEGPKRGAAPTLRRVVVKPPEPPDVSWLQEGVFDEQEVVEEIPLALILIPEQCGRAEVVKAVEALGYRAELATSAQAAIDKMEFVNYSGVILHAEFEQGGLGGKCFSSVHVHHEHGEETIYFLCAARQAAAHTVRSGSSRPFRKYRGQ